MSWCYYRGRLLYLDTVINLQHLIVFLVFVQDDPSLQQSFLGDKPGFRDPLRSMCAGCMGWHRHHAHSHQCCGLYAFLHPGRLSSVPVYTQSAAGRHHDPGGRGNHCGHSARVHRHSHGALQSRWYRSSGGEADQCQRHTLADQRWTTWAKWTSHAPVPASVWANGQGQGDSARRGGGVQMWVPPEQSHLLLLLLFLRLHGRRLIQPQQHACQDLEVSPLKAPNQFRPPPRGLHLTGAAGGTGLWPGSLR